MSILERVFPTFAMKRLARSIQLERLKRAYDAAKTSPHHRRPTSNDSADSTMTGAGDKLRAWSRYLDENHDLAIGILDALVNNVVGTGITVEPAISRKNGKPVENVNKQIRDLWEKWIKAPDVTGELSFSEVQRLACRSMFRDGECFAHEIRGRVPSLRYKSEVPYLLELLEADFVPYEHTDDKARIVHGVKKNAWGRPLSYFVYKEHPGSSGYLALPNDRSLKEVSAEEMIHIKFTRRIKQTRGVSIFHGIAHRLDDMKDYEESERIAARISAAFTGYIKKPADGGGISASDLDENGDRTFEMSPGMIFENLLPGEEVGTIASNRPNPNLQHFRDAMLRACAAGVGASYSTISRNYNGTYSAQRQELVETSPSYKRLRDYFIDRFVRVVYEAFIDQAIESQLLKVPAGLDPYAAEFIGVGMPWIDPKKEIEADALAVENGFKSRTQVIRERGGDPRLVDQQNETDTFEKKQPEAPKPEAQEKAKDDEKDDEKDDDSSDDEEAAA